MNRVKELRIRAGMQQKELAIALNVQQPSISRWEKQKADPTDENAEKMAELFGVTVSYILCRDQSISDAEYANAARGIIEPPRTDPPLDEPDSPVLVALYGDVHDLSDDEAADVRDYIRFLKSKRK